MASSGTLDLGWVDGDTILGFVVDRAGRNIETTYTIRVHIATPPTVAPDVTAVSLDHTRARWSWTGVDNDPTFYEHRLTIDGATNWFNTGLLQTRTRGSLSSNRCYRGEARGGNQAGTGPHGSALVATLNQTPSGGTVLGVGNEVGSGALFINLTPGSISNYTAPASQCEGNANQSRYWVRGSECNAGFGFVRETPPASGDATITWDPTELGGPGCYDFQIRALNWFGDFRGADDPSDATRTFNHRSWTGAVQGITGTPTSTSAIDWAWTAMRGAGGYYTGPTSDAVSSFTESTSTSSSGHPQNTCSALYVQAWAEGVAPNLSPQSFGRVATLVREAVGTDFLIDQINGTGMELTFNTGGIPGYGSAVDNCGSRTAIHAQVRQCDETSWTDRVGGDPEMIAGTSAMYLGMDAPGCYEIRVRYRNRSGHWNNWVEFRRWLGLDLGVTATTNRTDGIMVGWNTYPGLVYDLYRSGELIAAGLGGGSYLDTTVSGPVPAAPTGLSHSSSGRSIFLEWLAPGPAPFADLIGYTVVASDDGVSVASGSANGRRAESALTGYEVRVLGSLDWTDTGSLLRQWEHANVPGAGLSFGENGGTASQGTYTTHVLLDGPVDPEHSTPPIQYYQVRAVNASGAGPATSTHEGALAFDPAQDVYQWEREEGGSWIEVGAPGITVEDFGAPADGTPRWYRLRRTNPGTDSIAYGPDRQGWRKAPPGPFDVFGSGIAGSPLSIRYNWTPSSGAESYAIARDGAGGGTYTSTGTNLEFTYINLQPNTCYTGTVRATNGAPPDTFASGSYSTSFANNPRPEDLDFVSSADGQLEMRFSSAAVPGIGDSLTCAGSSNLSAILVSVHECLPGDVMGAAIGAPTEITSSARTFSFDMDGLDCVFVRAIYRSRLGLETEWGDLGVFKGAPAGTPSVFVLQPVGFVQTGSEVQGSHFLNVEWSTVSSAEGYNFEMARVGHGNVTPGPIKVPGGDAEITFRNLGENTCYEARAQAFNVAGVSPWGTARAATSIRSPIFRDAAGDIHGDGRGLSCEPGESVEVVNNPTNEAFQLRIFDRPPGFSDNEACALDDNRTAFRYRVRRCELFDGLTANEQTSDWLASTESPWIDTDGHHCFEIRMQYRNRDGIASPWSEMSTGLWYRHIILDLRPPEDLDQVGADYETIIWGWSDASRGETRWDVRGPTATSDTMASVFCMEYTRNRPLLAGEYPDSAYECSEAGITTNVHGNSMRQRRIRSTLVDPDNPTVNPWRYFGTMSENIATGYTLVRPADICGDANRGEDCGLVSTLGPERDFMINEITCDRVDNNWVNCRLLGRMMAPNTRSFPSPGVVCGGDNTNSYTGQAGARLVRQRITYDGDGNAVPAGAEVVLTSNQCLDGSCPNGNWTNWIENRGYGEYDPSINVWPGCSEGRVEDTGLTYGAIYRYRLWYYNSSGFINDATTWDVRIGCEFGTGLGVCGDGLPETIDVGDYPMMGACYFPGREDGAERCDDLDWSCTGDPYTNPGDPPGEPTFSPGGPCGTCNGGTYVCVTDPSDPLFGDQVCEDEDAGVNECLGCNVLAGSIGDPCDEPEGCGGELGCDPLINPELAPFSTRLICINDDPDYNECGINCLPLPNEPGDSCGICGEGAWVCDVGGGVFCDGEDNGLNSCPSGMVCHPEEPGTLCTVPDTLGVCADGVWSCLETDMECLQVATPTPELCNGLDDDCNGLVDDGARVVAIDIVEVYDGVNPPPQPCDIEADGDVYCTGIRFELTSSGTDSLPDDTRVDVINVLSDGTEVYLVEAVPLGREVPGGGSVNTFTLCWENPEAIQDANLVVRMRDPESSPVCLDPDTSESDPYVSSLGACGPEICDGYDNNMDGEIDTWPLACGEVDLECVAIPHRLCSSDADCVFSNRQGRCNAHQGICYNCEGTLLEGEPCTDGGCPLGSYCAPTGVCSEGCLTDAQCDKDEICYEGVCIDGVWRPAGAEAADSEASGDDVDTAAPEADLAGDDVSRGPLAGGVISERPGTASGNQGCSAASGRQGHGWPLALLLLGLGWVRRRR